MKKRISVLALIFILGTMTISCFNKKDNVSEDKDKTVENVTKEDLEKQNLTTGTVSGRIFDLGGLDSKAENTNSGIDNLTAEEQNILIENQIDPQKVSEAIKKAESGEKEAIMSLSQLYYNLKDNEKVKKYLKMGVAKNYPEAIYNLAVLYKEEGNTAEANKLIARLPKNTNVSLPAGAEEYNKAITFIKNKKYKQAKEQFEIAYKKGIKDVDIRIALLNKELKNTSEALKWFKIANSRGVKGTNFEIGAILYDSGKLKESRTYLLKAYNEGEKDLAMPIAFTYQEENNTAEALKWFKTAAKNGNKDAANIVAQLENPSVSSSSSGKSGVSTFLNSNSGNSNLSGSYMDNTLAQTREGEQNSRASSAASKGSVNITGKNSTDNVKNDIQTANSSVKNSNSTANSNGTVKTESNLPTVKTENRSTAREKNSYNVEINEIAERKVMEIQR